jgi:hypothetical protein
MGANIRAQAAREDAQKAIREAYRATAEAWSLRMEGWRARSAVTDDRTVPEWRPGLARGGVQSLQDPSKPTAGRNPAATGYADLEARSIVEVQVVQEAATRRQCG